MLKSKRIISVFLLLSLFFTGCGNEEKSEINESGELVVVERYKVTKYSAPDLGSIHLLLKNLDDSWHNDDVPTLKLKKEQLELSRQKAEW
jgi:hypothetical protein